MGLVTADIDQFLLIKDIVYSSGRGCSLQYLVDARVNILYYYYAKEIFNMTQLESFDVSKFQVSNMPHKFINLQNLQCIYIRKGTSISKNTLIKMEILGVYSASNRDLIMVNLDGVITDINGKAHNYIY